MPYGRRAWAGSPYSSKAATLGRQVGGLSQNHWGKSIDRGLSMRWKAAPYKEFCSFSGVRRARASPAPSFLGGGSEGGSPLRVFLELERLEVGSERLGEIGPRQRELDRRLEKAELLARVMAASLELYGVDGPTGPERAQAVGELDLAAGVWRCVRQDGKEIWREDVAADDREIGRRVLGIRL